MKQILVTGGLGYIGSHTVVQLQESGYQVVLVDDLSNSHPSVIEGIQKITGIPPIFHRVDLKERNHIFKVFEKYNIECVMHFAAYKSVSESVKYPIKYYRNNIIGLLNLLDIMEEFNIKNLIFSSSCTVYGQADHMPISELTPLKKTLSPYGKTKQMGETIIEDWIKVSSSKAIVLRYFNPIGSHPSLHIGEFVKGEPNTLLPYILQTALGNYSCVKVFGNDYPTKDGTAIRDYIDVNDLANAHVKAVEYLFNHTDSSVIEFYNLGTGKGKTVLEIIKAFEKATHLKVPFKFCERRVGDFIEAYADCSLAQEKLFWEPKVSIEESLRNSWNFELSKI